MIYAPVLIPTLNRYEHLKQCLESLMCARAEFDDDCIVSYSDIVHTRDVARHDG